MKNNYSVGICIALLLLVVAAGLRYWAPTQSVVDANLPSTQTAQDPSPEMNHAHQQDHSQAKDSHKSADNHSHDHAEHAHDTNAANSSRDEQNKGDVSEDDHLSRLTPEMRQAIRDKLLLHGPMETVQNPDGSISLPANGRFTQMPVAVQNPDGTIEIREYSVIPDEEHFQQNEAPKP